MRKSIWYAVAALAGTGLTAGTAEAQSFAFGAGATTSQLAYRYMMDCLYSQAQGSPGRPPATPKAPHCPAFNMSGYFGEVLYAPTSSGNGKLVLRTNNIANIAVPGPGAVTYTDSTIGVNNTPDYDGIQFAFSDDVLNAADITAWNAAGSAAKFGNIMQFPTVIYTIGIGINGKDGTGAPLNIVGVIPTGGSSGLNLSRTAMCGIASGHVTKWNNAFLTASNGGVLGTGNVTFVHRTDSTVTSFLLSNALAAQCRNEFGPMNETDATIVSYAYPWTDRGASCAGLPLPTGANLSNWPDQFPVDQCGNVVANPGGGHFANASGNSGMLATLAVTNGALGYGNVDILAPFNVAGPKTANLQSQWDITASTGQFQPPTLQGGQNAMASANPHFNVIERTNPLQWSLQGLVPNPISSGAYPIAGFGWVEMYQCNQTHSNGNNGLFWFRNWLDFLYGVGSMGSSGTAKAILRLDTGLAEVPSNWVTEIDALLNDAVYGLNGSGCTGKIGAY